MPILVNTWSSLRLCLACVCLWPVAYALVYYFHAPQWGLTFKIGYVLAFLAAAAGTLGTAYAIVPQRQLGRIGGLHIAAIVGLCLIGQNVSYGFGASLLLHGLGLIILGVYIGGLIGRRVSQPSFIWPLIIVLVGATLVSIFDGPSVCSGLIPERPPKSSRSLFWINAPMATVGIDGMLSALEPIGIGLCVGFLAGCGLSMRRGMLGLAIGFGGCLVIRLTTDYPLPALTIYAPMMALMFGPRLKPKAKDLLLSFGVLAVIWIGRQWVL